MSKREISLYLVDIFIAIFKIKEYTKDFNSSEELLYSSLHWDGTIRELQILGEAINELIKNQILGEEYRKIVNFRNVITHKYFGIDNSIVWNIIEFKLDEIVNDIKNLISNNKIDIDEAIECSIIEYKKIKQNSIVEYLKTIIE